jgi:phosphotransferase system enzyme I (PtsI)
VVGIVTAAGSALSHSAILARSLHLPLIVNVPQLLSRIADGDVLIIDGADGSITANPQADNLRDYRARLKEHAREQRELGRLRSKPSRTRDQVDIALLANAESLEDVTQAHALGAQGWACTAPNSCSCSATSCRTKKNSSRPTAMPRWA